MIKNISIIYLLGMNIDEFWRIGINVSYADLRNTPGDLFQGNLFSKWSNGEDTTFISSIYGGTYKEPDQSSDNIKVYIQS